MKNYLVRADEVAELLGMNNNDEDMTSYFLNETDLTSSTLTVGRMTFLPQFLDIDLAKLQASYRMA